MFPARPIRVTASVFAAALAAALGGAAAAAEAAAAPTLTLRALTGPKGGTLDIRAATATFANVHVKLYAPDAPEDAEPRTINLKDVDLIDGATTLKLGQVERGTRVVVQAQARAEGRIVISRGSAITKLRPDVTVAAVRAPAQTLSIRPVDIEADLKELNGDTAADVEVTLQLGPTPVAASQQLEVAAGKTRTVVFEDVSLPAANATTLRIVADRADPFETDTTNNSNETTIDVTAHELTRSNVLVESLRGYGAQFNNHVYAPITPWPADLPRTDFETKAKALEPHLVRIFYNDNWDGNRDGRFPSPIWEQNYASFVKSVRLAQEAGAIIDISFQNLGNARSAPIPDMKKFADVLEDLVRNHGLTNVRWAEVGNEPNSGGIGGVSLAEYETLVRTLDGELRQRGLREQLSLMGPGLVENAGVPTRTHYVWMQWIAANMGDVLDAWGQHVYWFYNDTGRLEYRLRDVWHLLNEVIPPEQRKPVYMMEYGARGIAACPGKTNRANTYYAADPACPEIWRTNIAGFQQLWFAVASAQLGYVGALKWDAYWGVYDFTLNPPQVYWTIGPAAEGSPLMPSYHALSLLFHTTEPGWQVVGVAPWDQSDWTVPTHGIEGHASNDTPEQELAAYAGPDGQLTILGLDTRGGSLNGVSSEAPSQYSIGDLPANKELRLVVWNATGDGTYSVAATVSTNAAGVARFEVPLHAAFALTTVPIS